MVEMKNGQPIAGGLAPNFLVRTVWVPPKAVMVLAGELDLGSIETLDGSIEALLSIQPSPQEIVVSVRGLSFADLVGVRALVAGCRRLEGIARVEVWGIRTSIRRVLDLAGMVLPCSGDGQ